MTELPKEDTASSKRRIIFASPAAAADVVDASTDEALDEVAAEVHDEVAARAEEDAGHARACFFERALLTS